MAEEGGDNAEETKARSQLEQLQRPLRSRKELRECRSEDDPRIPHIRTCLIALVSFDIVQLRARGCDGQAQCRTLFEVQGAGFLELVRQWKQESIPAAA